MKLQFDKNQPHQLEAIESVVALLEGQPLNSSDFDYSFSEYDLKLSEAGVANQLILSEEALLKNLIAVQRRNNLKEAETTIKKLHYNEDIEINGIIRNKKVETYFPNYSVEMETGTGKTYVYLRTIYELNKIYGFKKFVIVVPSVAIREGVLKNLQMTEAHFKDLYKQPVEYRIYDATQISVLRNFATSLNLQILVINIDAFTKHANIINQIRETGVKPIAYLQKSRPVVIIDEPQNMETDIRKKAIAKLHPLLTLRYSATHKNLYNPVYKLDPVRAYDLELVKQIEVDSVISKNDSSGAFISLDGFKLAKSSTSSNITLFMNDKGGIIKKQVSAKVGDDLYQLSGKHSVYKEGYIINEIDTDNRFIVFSSGQKIHKGEAIGGLTEPLLKAMIEATVENHFKKEKELSSKGIKVLSLFFIDRVAHYRSYDEQGNAIKGKLAQWFEESFNTWKNKPDYKGICDYSAEKVHNGYFSQDKGKFKDSKEGKSTKADDETFQLIMRDKERLLEINTPLRFIFSHSALREGWDNPNVFQICTLNESKSDIKKRQEIGRGLRLCVHQSGIRNTDRSVNRLTVIANESYEKFSKELQKEIEDDCGINFEGRIKNARKREKVKLKDKWLEDALFKELWDKIRHKTEYKVGYSSTELIKNCAAALQKMPAIDKPFIYKEKNIARFIKDKDGNPVALGGEQKGSKVKIIENSRYTIPDSVAYIQSKTELTRATITQILLRSKRLGDIFHNPQLFMDEAVRKIKYELDKLKINGIQYEKIAGQIYEMKLFESEEIEQYLGNLITVTKQHKTLYNYIAIDALSAPEKKFAEDCQSRDDILFFVKLPKKFQIKTPIGPYNPDWALIKKEDGEEKKIYFVAETKDPKAIKDKTLLRDREKLKTDCAEKHFEAIDGVRYCMVGAVSDLKAQC